MDEGRLLDEGRMREIREWNLRATFNNGGNCPGFALMGSWPHVESMKRAALKELDRLETKLRSVGRGTADLKNIQDFNG